ncbi:hypothetical protein BU26DRAFT_153148 [Trematosphaeria pertusa]|uniref:Uncharacterized protein n=1 Tax=Trematosphaeria pertusa TaxID=390896 RepID=A0A6A6J1E6_9PLEO|nr:uncharacterized protein BU26DRAFT_153148 [Trematosphaeria pertusa]KAF2255263.1 hypothetical protein BU26DRAFT_153148 [Trematosphaeria pertusa]
MGRQVLILRVPSHLRESRQAPTLHVPSHLPREIFDLIISTLISLYDQDPGYQWSHLRYITRFHKRQLESHFLHFWLPRTILTVYSDRVGVSVDYRAFGVDKKTGLIARFKAREGWARLQRDSMLEHEKWSWWEYIMRSTDPFDENTWWSQRRVVLRMGEGVLNEGYAGGGILSNMVIPGLQPDDEGGNLWFEWKTLFSNLFKEEECMRMLRNDLLKKHMPQILTKKLPERRSMIRKVLSQYKASAREALYFYRHHLHSGGTLANFDCGHYKNWYGYTQYDETDYPTILEIIGKEESVVFQMEGWREWGVREVARLRGEEDMKDYNYWESQPAQLQTRARVWLAACRERCVEKDVNEEQLEKGLRLRRRLEDFWL